MSKESIKYGLITVLLLSTKFPTFPYVSFLFGNFVTDERIRLRAAASRYTACIFMGLHVLFSTSELYNLHSIVRNSRELAIVISSDGFFKNCLSLKRLLLRFISLNLE